MASISRTIRRNRVANEVKKEGMSRSEVFEWRRDYIAQLESKKTLTKKDKQRLKELKSMF